MTKHELIAVLGPLAVLMGKEMDAPSWTVYFRALEDVPVDLLRDAADRVAKSPTRFFPRPGEIRQHAEHARQARAASMPFTACEDCGGTGWAEVLVENIRRVERCLCWKAHQQQLAAAGVSRTPLALPETTEDADRGGQW